ncbi:hypothetical protein PE066_06375 [Ramlibacter tataouinensis]|uniref:hypothetical protein n=1 Tax=Ramlibacter tataouinensis TaxID=94132 RepID=UPI0022F3F597|nr:hypothetical protein [Ramlibacter tataouinensis]WBY03155.1 hypothetical protein PE066_06375 [Ramlibacter tataouinensis]
MPRATSVNVLQRALAVAAAVFGVATVFAGGRVLLGADPGYVVYRPLLVFNTAMGAAYLLTGVLGWLDARRGRTGAAAIALLNLLVLGAVAALFLAGPGTVARESIAAMTFRTVVWLLLWAGFARAARR